MGNLLRIESARSSLSKRRNFQNTNSAIPYGLPIIFICTENYNLENEFLFHRDVQNSDTTTSYDNLLNQKFEALFIGLLKNENQSSLSFMLFCKQNRTFRLIQLQFKFKMVPSSE
jgi:hypothetical protein